MLIILATSFFAMSNILSFIPIGCRAVNDDYSVKLKLDQGIETFHVNSLNKYIQLLLKEDCELLYAEKDEQMLILVFKDSNGRLVANTYGVKRDRVAWIAMEGKEFNDELTNTGFSFFEIEYPKTVGESVTATAQIKLSQGFVFVPSSAKLSDKVRLNLFLDDKKHRSITCIANKGGNKGVRSQKKK